MNKNTDPDGSPIYRPKETRPVGERGITGTVVEMDRRVLVIGLERKMVV